MTDNWDEQERHKYTRMWDLPKYRERSPGMRFLADGLSRLRPRAGATFVDLGCGTGRVSAELQKMGFKVTAVDIAPNACTEFDGPFIHANLWDLPTPETPWDYGFCADVMEHLPTPCVPLALAGIAKATRVVYFQIANFVCHEGDEIGEHLHLTVQPADWWRDQLSKHWDHVAVEAGPKHHFCVCAEPKR